MRIMIVGSEGQVGTESVRVFEAAGIEVTASDVDTLDITNRDAVSEAVERDAPDVILNCAAYTAVDKAEDEEEKALAVNCDGPAHLARACRNGGIPLFHISTDFVFDGRSEAPYPEEGTLGPLGAYGRTKLEGERAVARILPDCLIVRVSWVFASHGNNFVRTILRLAREKEELRVVSDQQGCPTPARDIARTMLELIDRWRREDRFPWGIYHFCGKPSTHWHAFAEKIVEEGSRHEALATRKIIPIRTEDYPTRALRPKNSVLDCRKIARTFGIDPPSWPQAVEEAVKEIYVG